jgi:hypothetical protein
MKKIIVLVGLMLCAPAYAQDATTPAGNAGFTSPAGQTPMYPPGLTEQASCWLGSMRFSPGAKVRGGSGVMLCATDFMWIEADGDALGCIRGGELHAVGDVQKLPNSATIVTCGSDGTWSASTE